MGLRDQLIKSALASCRHFNGIQNKSCRAGVAYESADYGGLIMPCIPKYIQGRETWPCELFEIMNQSDAEKQADERIELMERNTKALHAAKDDARIKGYAKGHGGVGSLTCPTCGTGVLRYSVASYNGHMHGRCTTKGCAAWME